MLGKEGIKILSIALLVLIVFYQSELIVALFNTAWDVGTLYFFIPFLVLVSGCVLFWMNNKLGIVFLTAYSTYAGVSLLSAGIMRLIIFVAIDDISNSHVTYMIFPTFEPVVQIFVGLIFAVICLVLSRVALLEEANINKNVFYRVVGISAIIALMLTF